MVVLYKVIERSDRGSCRCFNGNIAKMLAVMLKLYLAGAAWVVCGADSLAVPRRR